MIFAFSPTLSILLVVGTSLFLACVYIVTERLVRTKRCSAEITRRALHVLACLTFAANALWLNTWQLVALLCLFTVAVIISKRYSLFRAVHQVKRKTAGELLLPIGLIAVALIGQEQPMIFIFSCLVIGLADPAAGLVGTLKKSPVKTKLGSLVFFAVTFVILCFSPLAWWTILLVSLVATLIERYSLFGTDNLFIPLFVTLVLLVN